MAITINQIAELCGVSRGTVDRALHNKGNVRPELSARIKEVAAEYGYTPNRAGMALSRASHPTRIGVVLHSVQTPFISLVLDACRREAKKLSVFSTDVIFRLVRKVLAISGIIFLNAWGKTTQIIVFIGDIPMAQAPSLCPRSVGHFLRTVHTCYPFLFSAPAFALV